MKDKKKLIFITLGSILILGFVLRSYNLSYQSIWLDEAFSIYYSQQELMNIISLRDPSPPLYYTLLHFWIKFSGISESGVRLLSVIFGTASIFIIYLLGTCILNKEAGIFSAILLAFSPLHIYYSQEARTYSLLFLLTLLSMYFYCKFDKNASKWNLFGYFISTVLLLYSHFYALFIIFAQNIHLFIINKSKFSKKSWDNSDILRIPRFFIVSTYFIHNKKLKMWILIQALIFICYIPWIVQLFSIIPENSYSWIPRPSASDLITIINHSFSGGVFSFYGLTLTVICILLIMRYKYNSEKSSLFLIWITVPVLVPFIYSSIFTPIFTPKYVYFVSLPLFIMISQVLSSMKTTNKRVLLSVLVILSFATLFVQQNTISKPSWDNVAEYLQDNYEENDKIVIINSYDIMPLSYYFSKDCFQCDHIYTCSNEKEIYPVDTLQEVRELSGDNFWLIITRDDYNEEIKDVLSYFEENYETLESREYLLNQNSDLVNSVYNFLQKNNIIQLKFNKIRVLHFQKNLVV